MPVVTVAPNDALLEKLKSNMQEVRARGGVLYVLADADTPHRERRRHPRDPHARALRPAVTAAARGAAAVAGVSHRVARGTDVDKPRNLAKSVTVECPVAV
jgi:glucosamine--fructose-6-phosphate aminotransferase (isomerizing)